MTTTSRATRGVLEPWTDPEGDWAERVHAMAARLPGGVVLGHLTAAALHGLWTPPAPPWLPVFAVLPPQVERVLQPGLYSFRSRAGLPNPVQIAGLPVVSTEVCLGQLAEDLALVDLVAAIDGALHRKLCSAESLRQAARRRQRGVPRLRAALTLCDDRSESPWESVLRLMHVTCGIAVEPQYVVRDEHGQFVSRADLRVAGTRRLSEYDGAPHRTADRHRSDLSRDKALARLGWDRYPYTATEIIRSPERVIADAEAALGLTPDPERVEPWLALARKSTITAAGRAAYEKRLSRFIRATMRREGRRA